MPISQSEICFLYLSLFGFYYSVCYKWLKLIFVALVIN